MPLATCRRCDGSARFTDQNPAKLGFYDWCDGCSGTGYLW